MYSSSAAVLLLVAAAGHAAIWVAVINQTHARGWPLALVKRLTRVYFLVLLAVPPLVACRLLWVDPQSLMPWRMFALGTPCTAGTVAWQGYLGLCWLAAAATLVQRLRWMALHDVSQVLRFHRSRRLATGHVLHSPDQPHHAIVRLPGNESLELELTERGLDVPRLPPALEGLSIVHLSDFHFTGKIGKPFFEEIVRMSNALDPDIVALTGDLVEQDEVHRLDARHVRPLEGPLRRVLHLRQSRSPKSISGGCGA